MTRFQRYPHRADLADDYREACATEGHDLGETNPAAPGWTGVCRRCDVNVEDEHDVEVVLRVRPAGRSRIGWRCLTCGCSQAGYLTSGQAQEHAAVHARTLS